VSIFGGLRGTVGSVANRAAELALPVTCAGCYRAGTTLCGDCRRALEDRLAAGSRVTELIVLTPPAPLQQLEWCGPFDGITRRALERLSIAGERRMSEPLGTAIAKHWAMAGADADLLVPVPTTPDRVRQLGYDHGVVLAQVAGRRLGIPVAHVLRRTAAGFDVVAPARVAGRSVVLVDDVVVTGATLAAGAEALLAAGARAVSAVTVAREQARPPAQMLGLVGG
jgi:predicted amidophosphoribosyltransferase